MVVLPDHIHAIWTLPPGEADFSLRWRLIKIEFAKAVPKTEAQSNIRGERAVWQRRFCLRAAQCATLIAPYAGY